MRVSVRIRELMSAAGLGVNELAQAVGVDTATAHSLVDGQSTEISMATLGELARVLNVTPPEIVAGVEEPQPSVAEAPAPRSIDIETDERAPLRGNTSDDPDHQQPGGRA